MQSAKLSHHLSILFNFSKVKDLIQRINQTGLLSTGGNAKSKVGGKLVTVAAARSKSHRFRQAVCRYLRKTTLTKCPQDVHEQEAASILFYISSFSIFFGYATSIFDQLVSNLNLMRQYEPCLVLPLHNTNLKQIE